ncbi:MAG: glycine--tRNA ligase [Firmicutes bacterium]|nr:glycine--tRNA ligase [Bacillota bacterium]
MDTLVALAKRRGLVFPSSEIYGGINSCWDYGPLGVELKRNVKEAWWQATIRAHDNVVGADTSIIMHPDVWRASGHVDNFTDPLVDCKQCKQRFRADQIPGDRCPNCGGELTKPRQFNLMFKTFMGPVEDAAAQVYLRPETAQGIFVDYKTIQAAARLRIPFGIGQIGKSFRNEVSPGNFIFRSREFEQMEMEFFVSEKDDDYWFQTWVEERFQWYIRLGVRPERLRKRPHGQEELAHYAKACIDVEYLFPFGWHEVEGIAHRGRFDLTQHQEHSGKDLSYFDDQTGEHYIPIVIEASAGVDRALLTFLADAYDEEEDQGETRVVLRLHPQLAPVKVAVFPLQKKPALVEKAQALRKDLARRYNVAYDEAGSIGRRYRRQDEVGTPYCITVDFQSLEDQAVTVRDRDTTRQDRVSMEQVPQYLEEKMRTYQRYRP